MAIKASIKARPNPPSRIRHLDRDGRVISPEAGVAWRVVPGDRDRIDPAAEYLFCAPDFLFPLADVNARALRLERDHRDSPAHV
jgi:hypothetical protein